VTLNDALPVKDQLTDMYQKYGCNVFDENMENWVQMARERKDIE
jgi:hypothetical protein